MLEKQSDTPRIQEPSEEGALGGARLLAEERQAVGALVSALRRAGDAPEVQGTAVNPSGAGAVGAHAAVGALGALVGQRWPLLGAALLALAGLSAWAELQGRSGSIGRLVPRRVGHNVIAWDGRCDGARPCLVLCAPLDGGAARRPLGTGLPAFLLAPGALALLGVLASPISDEASRSLSLIGGGALALCALVTLLIWWRAPWSLGPGPAGHQLLALRAALREAPPRSLDLAWVFTTGGPWRADGLEVFLLNHTHRLPPDRVRVLALVPAVDGLGLVAEEGRWRRVPADALLVEAAREAGLGAEAGAPEHQVTVASRARWLGWRSAALAISGPAPLPRVLAMLAALDRAAAEGRW